MPRHSLVTPGSGALLETLERRLSETGAHSLANWGQTSRFITDYMLRPGGKSLRPRLFLAAYVTAQRWQKLNIAKRQELLANPALLRIAWQLEHLHTALLALDDLLDQAEVRRGGEALHITLYRYLSVHHSNKRREWLANATIAWIFAVVERTIDDLWQSLLCFPEMGHRHEQPWSLTPSPHWPIDQPGEIFNSLRQLLLRQRQELAELPEEILGPPYQRAAYFAETLEQTLRGEQIDIKWAQTRRRPNLAELFELHELKTTRYSLMLPIVLGLSLAGCRLTDPVTAYLNQFAIHFGRSYQIEDDLLELGTARKSGKSSCDLVNGTVTILTVLAYAAYKENETETQELNALLEDCRTSGDARKQARELIQSLDIPYQCREIVRKERNKWRSALRAIKPFGYDPSLIQILADFELKETDDLGPVALNE